MNGFIDEYTAKCMLGPMSKDIKRLGNLFLWKVGKKDHFVVIDGVLNENDFEYLSNFESLNFHYLSPSNINFLVNKGVKVEKSKETSFIIGIDEINYIGNKNKTIRNYMNRYKDYEIIANYKSIKDVQELISEWSITLGDKYFRDFSGKNKYFLSNNFHENCTNVFVYENDKLISFGVASPVKECYCSYVIGKALSKTHPGLSEFTDMKLYEKIFSENGPFKINMGKATGGLVFYKKKFPNVVEEIGYDGKAKIR